MTDRAPMGEGEIRARAEVVALAREMLEGRLSYFEGAVRVLRLRGAVGGVRDRDEDFDAFSLIGSETDHLPLDAQRPLWSAEALFRLKPEIDQVQSWAESFAPRACANLIARFANG